MYLFRREVLWALSWLVPRMGILLRGQGRQAQARCSSMRPR